MMWWTFGMNFSYFLKYLLCIRADPCILNPPSILFLPSETKAKSKNMLYLNDISYRFCSSWAAFSIDQTYCWLLTTQSLLNNAWINPRNLKFWFIKEETIVYICSVNMVDQFFNRGKHSFLFYSHCLRLLSTK
jgi:hypothetical protein